LIRSHQKEVLRKLEEARKAALREEEKVEHERAADNLRKKEQRASEKRLKAEAHPLSTRK
jgi:hypothetical protein